MSHGKWVVTSIEVGGGYWEICVPRERRTWKGIGNWELPS